MVNGLCFNPESEPTMTKQTATFNPTLLTMERVLKITLIDDDPIAHLIADKLIQRLPSFKLESFTEPERALEAFQKRSPGEFPDMILLDINMPGMNGWTFLEAFEKLPQEALERTCVFMLSSSDTIADQERARRFGIVKQFFSKPLTVDMLKAISMTWEACGTKM